MNKLSKKTIYVPAKDYDSLINLVEKIVSGDRNWTSEELQLQQNYSEAMEVLLNKKRKSVVGNLMNWYKISQKYSFQNSANQI